MNFKALALAAATATSIIAVPSVEARGTYTEHGQLGNAIKSTGVVLKFNPMECNKRNSFGWYWSGGNEMVICQENRSRYSTSEVQWTEEDLDTLRHEAQHLVQDCMDGNKTVASPLFTKTPLHLLKTCCHRDK